MSDIQDKLSSLTPEQRALLLKKIKAERGATTTDTPQTASEKGMDFSLIFFSGDGGTDSEHKYGLLLECARFADNHGFSAVITPERHFQPVGGLFPNPSVLNAALAMITKNIQLRAGSVVLPLHNPLRVAEEWSLVDNLSQGRAAISCATGWHPADFLINPEAYENRRATMLENIALIRQLWRGEPVQRQDIAGNTVEVNILPRPIQKELPMFLTSSGNPDTWLKAGELGMHVLCSLTNHTLAELKTNIAAYRDARVKHGYDPESGIVSVMVHTFVGEQDDVVKKQVREPLRDFLNGYINQNDTLNPYKDRQQTVRSAIDNDREALLTYAFEKHFNQTSLMGSPEKCARMVKALQEAGANEIACLVDFGLSMETVLAGLEPLAVLKAQFAHKTVSG
ncbi:MupA/Atu3671 family FMN-dependent luciferase-like monooxygenase [Pectobacterium polaris]|uniref:MupA/Atu3671 family FMN-dependent luciferase-like monooxygenase n=1 Tax=Pectobacterium polaris TaxID=2042057 RepID=UPI0015837AC6|nr:MupA/Atu3671 family FMN-dependent luciferase-like monooxygenase [Pectobacterium polaris]MCL6360549.1 LLM class flavin-dependent oxidoreductase [Pectobacterium polaris]UAY91205.1 LLM class flavin-dependent oxidoreductase [Pectobacterium polaris]